MLRHSRDVRYSIALLRFGAVQHICRLARILAYHRDGTQGAAALLRIAATGDGSPPTRCPNGGTHLSGTLDIAFCRQKDYNCADCDVVYALRHVHELSIPNPQQQVVTI
ncbi:MAG: hypothetical protein KDE31_20700 [Caldilineaceae bacterium]|nr:hypothetical protein [Caldilineaceae bacterium]